MIYAQMEIFSGDQEAAHLGKANVLVCELYQHFKNEEEPVGGLWVVSWLGIEGKFDVGGWMDNQRL